MSEAFRLESRQQRLACCCDECAFFVLKPNAPPGDDGACALLFPTAPHRRARWDAAADGDALSFCKMFEPDDAPTPHAPRPPNNGAADI